MSINYKDSSVVKKKSKEVKEKKEVKLGHPPSDGLDQMPSYHWAMQELTGTENASYEYKDCNNKTCFFVRRYEPHDEGNDSSKKRIVPYSYDLLTGTWVQKAWTKNRPLFHESRLSKDKEVIIPEGENAVLEAEKIFKDHDCVTWSGGSKAVSKTTFEALKGKKVILFPDNDKAGLEAMHEVAKTLIEEGITEDVHLVDIPEELPEGWDLADHISSKTGITTQGILDSHKEYEDRKSVV